MSTDIEQAAHAEAHRRYQGDTDVQTGDPVDDWGYSEEQRRAFVAGAVWATARKVVGPPLPSLSSPEFSSLMPPIQFRERADDE